jgi:hypothetical protein
MNMAKETKNEQFTNATGAPVPDNTNILTRQTVLISFSIQSHIEARIHRAFFLVFWPTNHES